MNKYIPVIGLEIHVELKTKSKMFCQCRADYFAKKPNTQTCPVCLGLPGALPVPNKKAIEWVQKIGAALDCKLRPHSKFDRKHYNYPDLAKGYQISQYDEPFAVNGRVTVCNPRNKTKKSFGITRVHMEEDTAKLTHKGSGTYVNFNRSGVPLVEIVTEPDFHNADDVKMFLEELQVIIRYLDVSDADMEKGSMRMEPNISLQKITNDRSQITKKSELPNYKVEVKNINSFRFVKQAIEYEIKRQTEILEKGKTPVQETRGWDDKKNKTYSQRSKEEAQDYRYFPEPDIPPFIFEENYMDEVGVSLPELPQEKIDRYVADYKVRESDAFVLTRSRKLAEYFEKVVSISKKPQQVANLIINKKISIDLTPEKFCQKVEALLSPKVTDRKMLSETVKKTIVDNPKVVSDYKAGKKNVLMFLVGQVMKAMKGRADANLVRQQLLENIL
jgi:aspartyl-tRNA(Asn)/glutamyl-tRNA(Gln) amidotransferase subunit B